MDNLNLNTQSIVRSIRKFIELYREADSSERLTMAEVAALSKAIEGLETFDRLSHETIASHDECEGIHTNGTQGVWRDCTTSIPCKACK